MRADCLAWRIFSLHSHLLLTLSSPVHLPSHLYLPGPHMTVVSNHNQKETAGRCMEGSRGRPSGCFWQVHYVGALPLCHSARMGMWENKDLCSQKSLCDCSFQWVLKRERLSKGPAWDPGSVFGGWKPGQGGGGFSVCPPDLGRGCGHGLNLCQTKCGLRDAEGICFPVLVTWGPAPGSRKLKC